MYNLNKNNLKRINLFVTQRGNFKEAFIKTIANIRYVSNKITTQELQFTIKFLNNKNKNLSDFMLFLKYKEKLTHMKSTKAFDLESKNMINEFYFIRNDLIKSSVVRPRDIKTILSFNKKAELHFKNIEKAHIFEKETVEHDVSFIKNGIIQLHKKTDNIENTMASNSQVQETAVGITKAVKKYGVLECLGLLAGGLCVADYSYKSYKYVEGNINVEDIKKIKIYWPKSSK